MRLSIKENDELDDIYIRVCCPHLDENVERLISRLRLFDRKISGKDANKTYLLIPDDIFYAESVDKHTFLYTQNKVLESPLRIYELEEQLAEADFVRISKQMVINFDKVSAIKPDLNARLQLVLSNHETVIASRQYARVIKQKLGL